MEGPRGLCSVALWLCSCLRALGRADCGQRDLPKPCQGPTVPKCRMPGVGRNEFPSCFVSFLPHTSGSNQRGYSVSAQNSAPDAELPLFLHERQKRETANQHQPRPPSSRCEPSQIQGEPPQTTSRTHLIRHAGRPDSCLVGPAEAWWNIPRLSKSQPSCSGLDALELPPPAPQLP